MRIIYHIGYITIALLLLINGNPDLAYICACIWLGAQYIRDGGDDNG